jgi:CBS domain-containing protein
MHGRGVSSIPITDESGALVGVVSRTDLIALGLKQSGRRRTSPVMPLPNKLASDVMTGEPRVVAPGAPLRHAARVMHEHSIHRLFAIDDDHHLVGVISTRDLAAAVSDARMELPLSEVMTAQVIAIDSRAPLSAAIDLLERVHVTGLIVTDEELPIGMFTQLGALACRELPSGTPIDEVYDAAVICLPVTTKLHRAAALAAQLDVRRIVVCRAKEPVGVISGLDFARVIATSGPR